MTAASSAGEQVRARKVTTGNAGAVHSAPLPVVAVAGRPNVGKSTLVNRIVGRQAAIVQETPGVTRDRLELECEWNGRSFLVVDTGGVVAGGDTLGAKVTEQSLRAIKSADVVLFVVDVTTGVTGEDADVAKRLRPVGGKVIVVANKVDTERREGDAWELASLGLGQPVNVSALHGRGTGDLLDLVVERLPDEAARPSHLVVTDATPGCRRSDGQERPFSGRRRSRL